MALALGAGRWAGTLSAPRADGLLIPAWGHQAGTKAGRCQAGALLLVALCAVGRAPPPQLFSFPQLSPHGSHKGWRCPGKRSPAVPRFP